MLAITSLPSRQDCCPVSCTSEAACPVSYDQSWLIPLLWLVTTKRWPFVVAYEEYTHDSMTTPLSERECTLLPPPVDDDALNADVCTERTLSGCS